MASFASAKKVERLEQEVSNLQTSMDALTNLFIELRDQVAPMPSRVAYAESLGLTDIVTEPWHESVGLGTSGPA